MDSSFIVTGARSDGLPVELTIMARDIAAALKTSKEMGLKGVVVTTVLDDHLPLGGFLWATGLYRGLLANPEVRAHVDTDQRFRVEGVDPSGRRFAYTITARSAAAAKVKAAATGLKVVVVKPAGTKAHK